MRFVHILMKLDEKKPVVVCGDMNVAHQEIDLKNPHQTIAMQVLPMKSVGNSQNCYRLAWWIPSAISIRIRQRSIPGGLIRFQARSRNAGWRIDYFLVSERAKENMQDAKILTEIMGSDHCPVELEISF